MRIVEERHPGEQALLWRLGNATAIDSDFVHSVAIAWLFKENGQWRFTPRLTGNASLYYNAVFFLRYTATPMSVFFWIAALATGAWWLFLFGLFASVRWSASSEKKALWQGGSGWKLNGRLGILCRIQSDASSAAGSTGPNVGQAQGFEYGTH